MSPPSLSQSPQSHGAAIASHCVDDLRPLRVICIGAGVSGILTGIRFPREIPNLELVIYEKNAEVGGTWFENTYPGVRCDIPSAGYQFTFESNPGWTEFYASGQEIQEYWVRTARNYGVHQYCKFRHALREAVWSETNGKWVVSVEDLSSGRMITDSADIIIPATGLLNRWAWPDLPGLETFRGQKVHTANWSPLINIEGQEVALVGAGSSGIQLLPTIQPVVKHCDHYVRGKNWISPYGIGGDELIRRQSTTVAHSKEELDSFKNDPHAYLDFRHKIEGDINQAPLAVFFGSEAQKEFHKSTEQSMRQKLDLRPDIHEALVPEWPPGCKRLTPGPGYLEACCADNVDYISTKIKQIHPDGIETDDGKIRKVSTIIFATGFDLSRQGAIKYVGQDGLSLDQIWDPIPEAYLSICPPKMPNMFLYFGPNGGPTTGSTIHMLEWSCNYMIRCIQKLQREFLRSMVVTPRANRAFSTHVEKYFAGTVFMQPCPSWFKRGQKDGRQVVSWPGSGVHARKSLMYPRFEDFQYEYLPTTADNELAWLGNGMTLAQVQGTKTTDYLDTVDIPKVEVYTNGAAGNTGQKVPLHKEVWP